MTHPACWRRILPNLKDWLPSTGFTSAEPSAKLWPTSREHLTRTVYDAYAAAGGQRVANGGSPSCITCKIARTGDVTRTAVELGNSPEVINSTYRGLPPRPTASVPSKSRPTWFNEWDRASLTSTSDRLNPPRSTSPTQRCCFKRGAKNRN